MSVTYIDRLGELLHSGRGADWLESALLRLETTDSLLDELVLLSAMARRKLGDDALVSSEHLLATRQGALDVSQLLRGDAGRIVLVLKAIGIGSLCAEDLVTGFFHLGDEREKAALTRGLVLFSNSDSLKPVALECGRTNSLLLFECLAVGNPYPAAFYTAQEYNQLVLKALFTGVNIDGIIGLHGRANRELSRMCEDYVAERRAAGREVPADIWLALAPHASPVGEQLLVEYAHNEDRAHRDYVQRAIRQGSPDN